MLTKKHIDLFWAQIRLSHEQMIDYKPRSQLHHIEARFTLFCLERCLSPTSFKIESDLVDFFHQRWVEAIRDTDVQYLHDAASPANRVCVAIARDIGKIQQRPYLGLLMPTLLVVSPDEYTTSSYIEPDLLLHDLILSDCNTRLIHLPDVLDSAQEDGVLKHNSLIINKIKPLSFTEKQRFLSRHITVNANYEALMARIAFKLNGDTVGAAIMRLIQGLRLGGSRGRRGGSEESSGATANEAIIEFHEYLETLDETIRRQLMSASKIDRFKALASEDITIKKLWDRLTCDKLSKYRDTIYCVELIADRLDEILKENAWLYDLVSYWGNAPTSLSELNEDVIVTRALMTTALPLLEQHPCYGAIGDDRLSETLAYKLTITPGFLLGREDILYFMQQYTAINSPAQKQLRALLTHITKTHLDADISAAIEGLEVKQSALLKNIPRLKRYFLDFETGDIGLFAQKRPASGDGGGPSADKRPHLMP